MSNGKKEEKKKTGALAERFVGMVEEQFAEKMGASINFSDYEKKLSQHLFLRVDQALKDFEDRRSDKSKKTPYNWNNVNMMNLALSAVWKVELGLDALMDNHIHPVPYFNSKNGKYDLDLQTGYAGLEYIALNYSVDPQPIKIITELVHETDEFQPLKKNYDRDIESYKFEIKNPFNRGEVIGGFGYIMYDDPKLNQLVIVDAKEFEDAQKQAPMKAIWENHPKKMKLKTTARRTIGNIKLDPKKVNKQAIVHESTGQAENKAQREIDQNSNSEFIDAEFTAEDASEGDSEKQKNQQNGKDKSDNKKEEKKKGKQKNKNDQEKPEWMDEE